MKITTRCGQRAIDGLNDALLAKAVEAKVLKTNRVRADTTVVEANVAYPSDSALLAKGVAQDGRRPPRSCRRWGWRRARGWRTGHAAVRARARSINANLRRRNDDRLAEVHRINGELAGIAERVARQADAVVRNARRTLRRLGDQATGRARAAVDRAGTHRRADPQESPPRPVSVSPGPRPTGRPGWCRCTTPMPARSPRAGSANRSSSATRRSSSTTKTASSSITTSRRATRPTPRCSSRRSQRIKQRTGRAPRAVTADRGYGERGVEDALRAAGVRYVVLPTQRQTNRCPSPDREPTRLPQDGPMAHRLRRTDQLRQTRLRARPAPASTDSPAPEPGAATASSPTTSSRSAHSSHDTGPTNSADTGKDSAPPEHSPTSSDNEPSERHTEFFRSKSSSHIRAIDQHLV